MLAVFLRKQRELWGNLTPFFSRRPKEILLPSFTQIDDIIIVRREKGCPVSEHISFFLSHSPISEPTLSVTNRLWGGSSPENYTGYFPSFFALTCLPFFFSFYMDLFPPPLDSQNRWPHTPRNRLLPFRLFSRFISFLPLITDPSINLYSEAALSFFPIPSCFLPFPPFRLVIRRFSFYLRCTAGWRSPAQASSSP